MKSNSTGYMPHLSRDIYHLPITNDISMMRDMEKREEIVAYIMKRMKEKKINPRRLSLMAGASPDLIRNYLSGRSRVMQSNHYNKVMEILSTDDASSNVDDPIRGQIDSSIILWAKNGDRTAIHTLASAAYKGLRPTEEEKNLSDKPAEALILSCLMRLQSLGKTLNKLEMSFIFWIILQMPESFKDDARELCAQIFKVDNIEQLRKINRANFFDFISNASTSQYS